MIGLLQRVSHADVVVDGESIAHIGLGLAVLVGVERGDTDREAARLLERLLAFRVFADDEGRMNLSVHDVGGELLLGQPTGVLTGRGVRSGSGAVRGPRALGGEQRDCGCERPVRRYDAGELVERGPSHVLAASDPGRIDAKRCLRAFAYH